MIWIIDLVGKEALYLKTVFWVSSIILHIDTDIGADADADTGGEHHECGEAMSEHCGPITKWVFLNTYYLSPF